jgi:hypothetical protein
LIVGADVVADGVAGVLAQPARQPKAATTTAARRRGSTPTPYERESEPSPAEPPLRKPEREPNRADNDLAQRVARLLPKLTDQLVELIDIPWVSERAT